MKEIIVSLLLLATISSCNNKENIPDTSAIKISLTTSRFDRDFFSIDSNNVQEGINKLRNRYPLLSSIFFQGALGLDSAQTNEGVKQFLQRSKKLNEDVLHVFPNTDELLNGFTKAFQFVKYYFKDYNTPRQLVTVIGPVDALAQGVSGPTPNFLGPDFLGISLQFYLGKEYPLYNEPLFIERVAPGFRSRRFSKEYILADGMQLIVDDLYPFKSGSKPLVEQMIEKGKHCWLLDKFLPTTADSVITGYTQNQLNWCKENEGLIWGAIIKNDDLYSIHPAVIQTYIGESPFTQGFSQEYSPGNIGQWIGWQIVKIYADKNASLTPQQIMEATPKTILDETKYRPK